MEFRMRVLVGTAIEGKVEAVKRAFEKYFSDVEVVGVDVKSEVSKQPVDEETVNGAYNRVKNLIKYATENKVESDYFVAVESGLVNIYGYPVIMSACVLQDKNGLFSYGFSEGFPVPKEKVQKIKETSLSTVIDEAFDIEHTHKPVILGVIHKLTKKVISRVDLSRNSVIMALTRVLNDNWS